MCSCWTWSFLDITHFYEKQRQPYSESAMAGLPKNGKSGPITGGVEVSTQLVQQFVTAVTVPPLVSCAIWSLDEWLIHTVMALYPEDCTVVRTDAGLSEF